MNLTETQQHALENTNRTRSEQVMARCSTATELILSGQYEAACEALGDVWLGIGKRPNVQQLEQEAEAELLLQCGALSSGIGSARNMKGVHEKSKDLISEAQRLFESLALPLKIAEAQSELAICYWRLGAFDNARILLSEAAAAVSFNSAELRTRILIRSALIETWACRYHDAWRILSEAEAFFKTLPHPLKGRWHTQMAIILRRLGIAEGRSDYLDRAIIEYTAAIFHYQQSSNERYVANNLNNLAFLLFRVGRNNEAHEHLDRSTAILSRLNDAGTLAQVYETRAQVLLAEKRYEEALAVIQKVVQDFEVGGEPSCLADALTIQATVMARLGDNENSLAVFQRAADIAANAGALENAGHASLSLIEEHGADRLSELDLHATYNRADEFLKDTQDDEDISRLRLCARVVVHRLMGIQLFDSGFKLKQAVRDYEARFIEAALSRTGGKISHAAAILGLSHQTLSNIIKYRQNNLQDKRLPPTQRRRSILRKPKRSRSASQKTISVLYVEDDRILANAVKDSLQKEGFSVDVNRDGSTALATLKREKKYDVLIFDNEMDGINGVSLARQARELNHRLQTPIIVVSSVDVSAEAYRAGVNLFLQKPDEVATLTANIKRLLSVWV